MTKQIKWAANGFAWQVPDEKVSTVYDPDQLIGKFLNEEFKDVNPLFIKICFVTFKPKDQPNMTFSREVYVFYPEGMRELRNVPPIGSTDRWTSTSKEFKGDGFYVDNSPKTWILSVLNNLDPSEAFYSKVSLEYQFGVPDIYTATIVTPHGAK
jgi:hypothetical protein